MKRDAIGLLQKLNSDIEGIAAPQVTMGQIRAMVNYLFKKVGDQSEDGESKRLLLENQLWELGKVITDQTSDAVEKDRRPTKTDITKIKKV